MAGQGEIRRRIDAAGVIGGRSRAFREHVLGDGVRIVAVGAARDRALSQRESLADHQRRIQVARRRILANAWICASISSRIGRASAPAVVLVGRQALIEARVDAARRRKGRGVLRQASREVDLRNRWLIRVGIRSDPRNTAPAGWPDSPATSGTSSNRRPVKV